MDTKTSTLAIPSALYARIEKSIKDSQFSGSVEDFIIKTLEEKLGPVPAGEEMSQDDEEKIKERLKALGYMD